MPLYAAICLDPPPHSGDKRDEFPTAHREYVVSNDASIKLVGPLLDGDGNQCVSFNVLEADSAADVDHRLAQEHLVREGLYRDVIVREFFVGKNGLPMQSWPAAQS